MTMNYYELLGVSQNATQEEIKTAYKKQMKKWHPDINKDNKAVEMSTKINEAKEILLDPVKRNDYDEYLNNKIDETYNKYTRRKNQETHNKTNSNYNENNTVTKWEYLKNWLRHADVKFYKKIAGVIGVLVESVICFILRMLVIVLAYLFNVISVFIKELNLYLSPVLGIIGLIFLISVLKDGINNTIKDNKEMFNGIIITTSIFIISCLLPFLSNKLLSAKTFDIIYNKIDISLFKKCVGYKN